MSFEELNSVTGTSLLIRTDVLQDNGAVTVYSVVIVMGLFDISMLRYLPWFRTGFTAVINSSCDAVKDAVLSVCIYFLIMHNQLKYQHRVRIQISWESLPRLPSPKFG